MLSNLFSPNARSNPPKSAAGLRSSAAVAPLVIPTPASSTNASTSVGLHSKPYSSPVHAHPQSPTSSFTLKLGANRIPRPSGSSATTPTTTPSSASISITVPTTSTPTSSIHATAASNASSYSSVSSAMLIASAARAAGDLSLAQVAHSPSRASPAPSAATPTSEAHLHVATSRSDLLIHGGSSDVDDQIDRLNASIRLALHWAVNTAINPHTRRLYYEYRPPMVGDVANGVPPAMQGLGGRYPVMQQVTMGAGGRVLRRDAVAELQSLHRLYSSFLAVPPSDPVAQRTFSFSMRSILSYYTDLLIPLPPLPPAATSHAVVVLVSGPLASTTPLTLDDRALQEPCSVAALAALMDLLVLIGQAPLPKTQFASNVDDAHWVEATANGLAATLVLVSQTCPHRRTSWWMPAQVPPGSSPRNAWGVGHGPHVDDSRAVLDALCGLARFVAARAATAAGNADHRAISVMVGAHVRKLARTHLDVCAPTPPANAHCAPSSRRSRHVASPPAVHVHGGDWDPASVMEFDDEDEEPKHAKRSSSPHAGHRHDSPSSSESDSDSDPEEDTFMSERVALAVRATRLALLLASSSFPQPSSLNASADVLDDAVAHWDALSAAHYFVPLTVAAAPCPAHTPAGRAAPHKYQYSTAELARIVESLTQLLPHLDPVRRAMLKSPLAAAARELANRQVVRGADRLAVGGFVCRAMTTPAMTGLVKRSGNGVGWVSSPLAGRATPAAKAAAEECVAHHVPIVAEAIAALVVVVSGLRDKVASGTGTPGSSSGSPPDARRGELVGGYRAWSPPLV